MLLSTLVWQENAVPPAGMVERLRRAADAEDGFLATHELAWAAHSLTDAQLRHLAPELPVLGMVATLRDLFREGYRSPDWLDRLQSGFGVPLKTVPASVLAGREALCPAGYRAQGDEVVRLGMLQERHARVYLFRIFGSDGRWISGRRFVCGARSTRRVHSTPSAAVARGVRSVP